MNNTYEPASIESVARRMINDGYLLSQHRTFVDRCLPSDDQRRAVCCTGIQDLQLSADVDSSHFDPCSPTVAVGNLYLPAVSVRDLPDDP